MPEKFAEIEGLLEERASRQLRATGSAGNGWVQLAPEVFRRIFGVASGFLDLAVLDSTDPSAVLAHAQRLDRREHSSFPPPSLAVRSRRSLSSSISTTERRRPAATMRGDHFVAITDPGSGLADLAEELKFRHIFLTTPKSVGATRRCRFSASFPLVSAVSMWCGLSTGQNQLRENVDPRLTTRLSSRGRHGRGCHRWPRQTPPSWPRMSSPRSGPGSNS